MELIIVSCIGFMFAIGGGITFSKYHFSWVQVLVWGIITVCFLSWSPVALIVGIGLLFGFNTMEYIYLSHMIVLGVSCGVFLIVLSIVPLFSSMFRVRRV